MPPARTARRHEDSRFSTIMTAASIFHVAIDVATRQRDSAQKSLVQVQRSLAFATGQMDQLANYANETEGRWMLSAQVSAAPELLRHHYQFMDRLRQAIDLQHKVLRDLDAQVVEARKRLMTHEIRVRSLEVMLEKNLTKLKIKKARREQGHMDEFAAMQHARRRNQPIYGESP